MHSQSVMDETGRNAIQVPSCGVEWYGLEEKREEQVRGFKGDCVQGSKSKKDAKDPFEKRVSGEGGS